MATYIEFVSNHLILISGLMISFFLLVFTELQRKAHGITNIDPQEAVRLINADAAIIDLRSADSFAHGHIVNAKNIPQDELDENLEKISRYASKPIITVCDAGMNSAKIVNRLRKAGIDNVYGIRGGISAWTQASLPLVSSKKTRTRTKAKA